MDPMLGRTVGYGNSPEEGHRCLTISLGLEGWWWWLEGIGRREVCI